jgi:uncharacterized OB-fold protein
MTERTQAPRSPDDITVDSPFTHLGFFSALGEGPLLDARCTDCEKRLVPPRAACYACGGRDIVVEEQPRTGEIFSYTEVRASSPPSADLAPFTVAIVELESGARLTGRVDLPYAETEIGTSVRLSIREPSESEREAALRHE